MMRSAYLIFFIVFCQNSFSQDFKKILDSQVNKEKLQIATAFASGYMTKSKTGEFYKFQNEAVDLLKNQLTIENQSAIYRQLKDMFGDFKSLEYAEAWIRGNNSSAQIFRFKSDFTNSNSKMEVRVVVDESGKIAGLWIKPWSDMLQ